MADRPIDRPTDGMPGHRQGCGSGSDVFAWIRFRFSNFSGSGSRSGFQISLYFFLLRDPGAGPDADPEKFENLIWLKFHPPDPGAKNKRRKGSKS